MHQMRGSFVLATTVLLLSAAVACTPKGDGSSQPPEGTPKRAQPTGQQPAAAPSTPEATAVAELAALNASGVTGTVTFRETAGEVRIEAHVAGLTPGQHGFHIHANGDCSGDGTAAGDHFNPDAHPHGGPDSAVSHQGDMGNITADASGNAMLTLMSRRITLAPAPNGIVGRSVIIHESADDLTTDPTGNSGARIACGVIALTAGGSTTGAAAATGATGTTGAGGATP